MGAFIRPTFLASKKPPEFCGTVFALESANVVGYQEVDVPTGSSMKTSTFKPMAGEYKISEIKITGAAGGGMDYATKINPDGSWGQTYFYLTVDGTGYVEDGWYKDDFGGEAVNDDDALAPGESFQFTATANISLQFPAVL